MSALRRTVREGGPPLWLLLGLGAALRIWLALVWYPAFTGYSDSGVYFTGAVRSLWSDPIRTVGYSMFLRLLHLLWPELAAVTAVQALLGLVAAYLLYLSALRLGAPRWLALLCLLPVALGGDELFIEHAALADGLFIFLLCLSLYLASRAATAKGRAALYGAAALGLSSGLAVWVWGAGLALVGYLFLWLLFATTNGLQRRLTVAFLALLCAAATVSAYVVWRQLAADQPGLLTANNAYNLYARVAPWANCKRFTPPPGTRPLCEYLPPAKRLLHKGESYIYSPSSPAYRLFGPPYKISRYPHAMSLLASFSEAAILGQPLEYLHAVWLDLRRLYNPNLPSYGDDSANELFSILLFGTFHEGENGFVRFWQVRLYPHEGRPSHGAIGPLLSWERLTRDDGPLFLGCLLLTVVGFLLWGGSLRERYPAGRAGSALFGGTALVLLLFPILVKGYDYRFTIPAYGPFLAGGAYGAAAIFLRLRRTAVGSRRFAPPLRR